MYYNIDSEAKIMPKHTMLCMFFHHNLKDGKFEDGSKLIRGECSIVHIAPTIWYANFI